jgi:peptidoglycan/xylan/chitin deacetylase (PgdA/CDA1 family)
LVKLPILCYHKVGAVAEEGRRLNIEPELLDRHVRFFVRRGFRIVLPDAYMFSAARAVCFTFDDAYSSALDNAVPIFERYDSRSAFFVVTSLVGASSSWDGELARPLAGWVELESAHSRGFMVGNHTHTHPRLAEIPAEKQVEEITTATALLCERGLKGAAFCYPYGSLNGASKIIVGADYAVGLALGKRPATPEDDRLALPRIAVAYSDGLPKLLYKIHIRPLLP